MVDWSDLNFQTGEWKEFYPDAEETIPSDAPPPRGPALQLNLFVDAAHATDLLTHPNLPFLFLCRGFVIQK
jgi:hypothetical protein